jgi:oxysterol-binding protein-related protein 8
LQGVKKPYNPILGEIFRASWDHGNSKSFYVSEQVSHHPPVSAFYGSNRAAGFVLTGSIYFRSKFMGNSTAAILDGFATAYMLNYVEEYILTFPSAYARGILWGTLLMELGGTVSIKCEKTGMKSEIEFKTKVVYPGSKYLPLTSPPAIFWRGVQCRGGQDHAQEEDLVQLHWQVGQAVDGKGSPR